MGLGFDDLPERLGRWCLCGRRRQEVHGADEQHSTTRACQGGNRRGWWKPDGNLGVGKQDSDGHVGPKNKSSSLKTMAAVSCWNQAWGVCRSQNDVFSRKLGSSKRPFFSSNLLTSCYLIYLVDRQSVLKWLNSHSPEWGKIWWCFSNFTSNSSPFKVGHLLCGPWFQWVWSWWQRWGPAA